VTLFLWGLLIHVHILTHISHNKNEPTRCSVKMEHFTLAQHIQSTFSISKIKLPSLEHISSKSCLFSRTTQTCSERWISKCSCLYSKEHTLVSQVHLLVRVRFPLAGNGPAARSSVGGQSACPRSRTHADMSVTAARRTTDRKCLLNTAVVSQQMLPFYILN